MAATESSALPARPMVEAISLDLDDTLWPVLPTLIGAEQTLARWLAENAPGAASRYTDADRARLRKLVLSAHADQAHNMSFIRQQTLRHALLEAGEDPALAEPAFAAFLAARQQVTLFDEVREVLERWQQRFKLIAISNGNADLDRIGLGDLFSVKISALDVGFAKPDARIFALGCEQAGVKAAATLHIGDDYELDYQAARQAGMHAAWLRRPSLKMPVLAAAADTPHHFTDLQAIHDWLGD